MPDDIDVLRVRLRRYAKTRKRLGQLELDSPLGSGTDGYVWRTLRTAIKLFYREENFLTELACYQRLRERNAPESISGFWVPRLIDYDRVLMIVEMELVSPPFLIDFGKAYLDHQPSSIPPVAREEIEDLFEDRAEQVRALLRHLKVAYGIYYLDPRPGNIMFGDEWE